MNNAAKLSFIICTYNRADYLRDSLVSLIQTHVPSGNFEILVIDNNSTDETYQTFKKIAAKYPLFQLRYVKETRQGLSHARNRGIDEANSSYLVFLDDDIIATKHLISAWLSFFTEHQDAVAAGGKIHVQFDDPRPKWMSHFLLPLLGYHDLGHSSQKYPDHKYPFGGNMGFKKSIFNDAGLFDTDLGRKGASLSAGEEKEFFRRLRRKNHSITYVPEAFLYHRVNNTRLTITYIRKQALGLGESMKLQLEDASTPQKTINWLSEIGKLFISIPLGIFYILKFEPSKAKMLFLFRWWIWRGYLRFNDVA